jgi:hypothetical protein
MNHDIAHCSKDDCPLKESCKRYQAHLEAKKLKLVYVPYFEPTKDGQCEMYCKY